MSGKRAKILRQRAQEVAVEIGLRGNRYARVRMPRRIPLEIRGAPTAAHPEGELLAVHVSGVTDRVVGWRAIYQVMKSDWTKGMTR